MTPSSGPGGTIGHADWPRVQRIHYSDQSDGWRDTEVHPSPSNPSVTRDGVLQSSQILIPGLDAGTHTIKAEIGETVASTPFTITADDAPLPTTAEDTTR